MVIRMKTLEDLGALIRGERERRNVSQLHLARSVDLSQSAVSRIEDGISGNARALARLCDALDIPLGVSVSTASLRARALLARQVVGISRNDDPVLFTDNGEVEAVSHSAMSSLLSQGYCRRVVVDEGSGQSLYHWHAADADAAPRAS